MLLPTTQSLKMPLVFISYRREDEGPATRFLKSELDRLFGTEQIFMDTDDIRAGMEWEKTLRQKINEATVLICVIGKNWMSLKDQYHRRRIDASNDWVRQEIELSMSRNIKIIPLLMGVDLPVEEALPETIKSLGKYQSLSLSATNWRIDIQALLKELINSGISRVKMDILDGRPILTEEEQLYEPYPKPLSEERITELLKAHEDWKTIQYPFYDHTPAVGKVLERHYKFDSFEKAISFMQEAAKCMTKQNHHAEWTNVWRTVRVRLSSWDIEDRITMRDINLAKSLDQVYIQFQILAT